MSNQNFILNQVQQSAIQKNIGTSVQILGKHLRETPEFQAYIAARLAVNEDITVQHLYQEIQQHQFALQWGQGDFEEHQEAFRRLSTEFEMLPLIQDYRKAMEEAHILFVNVDEIISKTAQVPFAANAKKSCCG
ncbi:MAG TPA: YlbF family regulator [Anaerolineae bacterium]|nr:YlbF family regulator [Anaerolineae bacterium]